MKSFKQHLDERCWPGYKPTPGKKAYSKGSCTKEEVELQEGRPSQRHPLEGHEYHKKSDEALIHIAKDAHAAAEAMKGHNTEAENKYRDQANDSATVRHYRKTHGMADWYKKKYGHVKEEVKQIDELSRDTLLSYANKVSLDSQKHSKDPTKRSGEKASRSVTGYAKAHDRLEKPVKENIEQVDEIVKPDVKNDIKTLDPIAFVKKHGVRKGQAKSMAEESSMAEKQAQKQYRDARKDDVPFDPPYNTTSSPANEPKLNSSKGA